MTGPAIALILAAAIAAFYVWYGQRAQRRSAERLVDLGARRPESGIRRDRLRWETIRAFPPRHRLMPLALGVAIAVLLLFVFRWPSEIAVSVGILAGVLGYLLEFHVAEQRSATIEAQLAEAIDLLVGSLRAGASLLAAFESSLHETAPPLRQYLEEVVGRIRLGDDPRAAVSDMPVHVPLETFRLFATSLAVHWETGGSLATTLSTIGRTIRDRIELSRRVRAQSVEANVSVGVVMAIAYVLAYLMWRANPERIEGFMRTSVGTELVAGVIGLQAFGLVWMSKISRSGF